MTAKPKKKSARRIRFACVQVGLDSGGGTSKSVAVIVGKHRDHLYVLWRGPLDGVSTALSRIQRHGVRADRFSRLRPDLLFFPITPNQKDKP